MTYLEYRSIADMNRLILENLHKLPKNIDLVVGIPRSGMLPANLIALYLNRPFTDIDSFIEGRIYSSGERGAHIDTSTYKSILIVDDSINSGSALDKAKKKLIPVLDKFKYYFGVVFATTDSVEKVDFYCEIIDSLRVFQWNIFHHRFIEYACVDIDGVLCVDPPVDDDGPLYKDYIKNAPPLYIPTLTIDTLVSCRLEKYRKETEEWLANNNVKYKKLIMLNLPSKSERIKWGKHGQFKGEVMKKSGNILFIESSLSQAEEINRISGKPVFCTENFSIIDSNIYKKRKVFEVKQKVKKYAKMILGH